ncbi:unnamed protein product [Clonostachys chloroleuca]|uniref:Uncharacterized protein n=1 Tax=Clonostachys chloroleuca TaxID=1926264 RepID=A0AA35MAU5_9HYPO|nr:unnamed protein product [Clonostachys chloroleuca]
MANSRVNTPPAVVDSIEREMSEVRESNKVWGNVFAAVPSKSPLDRYQSTEQEASPQPRITLGSPWTPASYSLPQLRTYLVKPMRMPPGGKEQQLASHLASQGLHQPIANLQRVLMPQADMYPDGQRRPILVRKAA